MDECIFCKNEGRSIKGMYYMGQWICPECMKKIEKRLVEECNGEEVKSCG